ncbi:hypothetical protein A2U01_0081282, partial [Trifolium medium]|nr:hypothetical protein [Trifolium medium]
ELRLLGLQENGKFEVEEKLQAAPSAGQLAPGANIALFSPCFAAGCAQRGESCAWREYELCSTVFQIYKRQTLSMEGGYEFWCKN